jgi:hypothetical protein
MRLLPLAEAACLASIVIYTLHCTLCRRRHHASEVWIARGVKEKLIVCIGYLAKMNTEMVPNDVFFDKNSRILKFLKENSVVSCMTFIYLLVRNMKFLKAYCCFVHFHCLVWDGDSNGILIMFRMRALCLFRGLTTILPHMPIANHWIYYLLCLALVSGYIVPSSCIFTMMKVLRNWLQIDWTPDPCGRSWSAYIWKS